jgi:hypothetical protein
MKAFKEQLENLSEILPLPEEAAPLEPPASAFETLARARAAANLRRFALSLPGRELDSLLLLAGAPLSDDDQSLLCSLLAYRSTPRLAGLFWPVWQYRFENPVANAIARVLIDNCLPCPPRDNLKRVLDGGVEKIVAAMREQSAYVRTFLIEQGFLPDSPFGHLLFVRYFSSCGKEGFLLNEKTLASLLPLCSHDEQKGIITRYLSLLPEADYLYRINDLILSLWGGPYTSSDWQGVSDALRRKFLNWQSLRLLRDHFKTNKRKLSLLSAFIPSFRDIRFYGRAVVLDFGEFVVADTDETSPFSYYLKKERFGKILPEFEETGDFNSLRKRKKLPGAREYILEETEDSFMQLSYEDVGRLYIADMLKILLGAAPDLRRSKRPVKRQKITYKQ